MSFTQLSRHQLYGWKRRRVWLWEDVNRKWVGIWLCEGITELVWRLETPNRIDSNIKEMFVHGILFSFLSSILTGIQYFKTYMWLRLLVRSTITKKLLYIYIYIYIYVCVCVCVCVFVCVNVLCQCVWVSTRPCFILRHWQFSLSIYIWQNA